MRDQLFRDIFCFYGSLTMKEGFKHNFKFNRYVDRFNKNIYLVDIEKVA